MKNERYSSRLILFIWIKKLMPLTIIPSGKRRKIWFCMLSLILKKKVVLETE